jgi:molybdate transport system ATP-binding protein
VTLDTHDDDRSLLSVRVQHRIHPALSLDIDLQLATEIGVLFGASGSGKTTLLRLIAGLTSPEHGRIALGDVVLFDSNARLNIPLRSRGIGMIFQHDLLFPHRGVRENIGFGLDRWSRRCADDRIKEVAELCGVSHLLDRRPETLSGGERQRIGLARSLAPRPRILLCDEPVSALDLPGRNALIDRLKSIQRSERIPILYVTHSPAEAIMLGDRLFLIENGRISQQGNPIEILSRSTSPDAVRWDEVRNTFPAIVRPHSAEDEAGFIEIIGGPILHVPRLNLPPGRPVIVDIRASDIILSSGPVAGLSARNVHAGVVDQILTHGSDAEVIVRTGEVRWIVSVVASTVGHLGIEPGASVFLILKARSCKVEERRD